MTALTFSITGDYFTQHCRNRVLEGRWDNAMALLVEDLHGMTADIALKILKGDAKLTGVNDLDLAEDDAVEFKTSMRDMFAGHFIDSQGRYLYPYAVVTAWGPGDLIDPTKAPSSMLVVKAGKYTYRNPLVYAEEFGDVAVYANLLGKQMSKARGGPLGDEEVVLCRVVHNFPHMLHRVHRKVEDAVAELIDMGRPLRETGAEKAEEPLEFTGERVVSVQQPKSEAAQMLQEHYEAQERAERARLRITEYREAIIAQAAGDMLDIQVGEEIIRVPRAPFENWALGTIRRSRGHHLAAPWTPICPSGMKMINDDPFHSDWMIGAGLELDAMDKSESPLSRAAWKRRFDLSDQLLNSKCAILCGDGTGRGQVVHPKPDDDDFEEGSVIVIPNAGPRYFKAALKASAVITENGGSMAHLVTVGREHALRVVRVEDARSRYPVGSSVSVNATIGEVSLYEDDMAKDWKKDR